MTDRANQIWFAQETRVLINAFNNGNTLSQIAAALERSESAITTRLARSGRITRFRGAWHKVDPRPWSPG